MDVDVDVDVYLFVFCMWLGPVTCGPVALARIADKDVNRRVLRPVILLMGKVGHLPYVYYGGFL